MLNLTVTKRKRKTHQEKPPSTQAKVNAHLFSKRIEHVGFSKLSQANLTETEVERFMNLICPALVRLISTEKETGAS